jgi:hypothetical protein
VLWSSFACWLLTNRRRCRRAVSQLLHRSATRVGLAPVPVTPDNRTRIQHRPDSTANPGAEPELVESTAV